MKNFYRFIVCILVVVPVIGFAGRETEFSDKYPKFSLIIPDGKSVFFAGYWLEQYYVVVEYDSSGQWRTFSREVPKKYKWIHERPYLINDYVIYHEDVEAFNIHNKQWVRIPTNIKKSNDLSNTSGNQVYIKNSTIEVTTDNTVKKYTLPLPSANAYGRWRGIPKTDIYFDASIGSNSRIQNQIWFIIDYYDGEGSTGVGGLGVFDLDSKRFGVFRDSLLCSCSTGLMEKRGETLFIATGCNYEYGLYGCNGLVLLDIHSGKIAQFAPDTSPLEGSYFLALKLIDDTLWMVTDRAIIGWDIQKHRWFSTRADSIFINKDTEFFRRAILTAPTKNGGLLAPTLDSLYSMGSLRGSTKLRLMWPGNQYTEIQTGKPIEGWVGRDYFERMTKTSMENRFQFGWYSGVIYQNEQQTLPYHFIHFSDLFKIKEESDVVNIKTFGAWIKTSDIIPWFSITTIHQDIEPKWKTMQLNGLDLKEYAFQELCREQTEIERRVPVIDTVLIITNKTDLFDNLNDYIHARWLPNRNAVEPNGIQFCFFNEWQNVKDESLTVKGKAIFHNGQQIRIGDSWNVDGGKYFSIFFKLLDYTIDKQKANVVEMVKFKYKLTIIPQRMSE
jgi:hypothetical protein